MYSSSRSVAERDGGLKENKSYKKDARERESMRTRIPLYRGERARLKVQGVKWVKGGGFSVLVIKLIITILRAYWLLQILYSYVEPYTRIWTSVLCRHLNTKHDNFVFCVSCFVFANTNPNIFTSVSTCSLMKNKKTTKFYPIQKIT